MTKIQTTFMNHEVEGFHGGLKSIAGLDKVYVRNSKKKQKKPGRNRDGNKEEPEVAREMGVIPISP